MSKIAEWYQVQDDTKHVRQVVLRLPPEAEVPSRVKGTLIYRAQLWKQNWAGATLFMRGEEEEEDRGPFIFSKANDVVELLKGCEAQVAFAFYRFKHGGVLQIFVTVESLAVKARMGYPFITENAHWPDNEDTKEIIPALFAREDLEVCFLADEAGVPCIGKFGLRIVIPKDCREILKREWQSLQEYHLEIPQEEIDRQLAMAQFERENPMEENPVLPERGRIDILQEEDEEPESIQSRPSIEKEIEELPKRPQKSSWRIALGAFLSFMGVAGILMILSGDGSGAACFGVPIMLFFGIGLLYQGITGKGIKAKKEPALIQSQSIAVEPSSRLKASESVDKKTPWLIIIIVTVVVLVFACVGCSIVAVLINLGGV